MTGVALPVVLLVTTANVLLEFDTMDDAKKIEEAKDGRASALLGLTSSPVPQGMSVPSGWVEFAGGVVKPEDVAIANRPVTTQGELFTSAGAMYW
jgi:hypothetical protein